MYSASLQLAPEITTPLDILIIDEWSFEVYLFDPEIMDWAWKLLTDPYTDVTECGRVATSNSLLKWWSYAEKIREPRTDLLGQIFCLFKTTWRPVVTSQVVADYMRAAWEREITPTKMAALNHPLPQPAAMVPGPKAPLWNEEQMAARMGTEPHILHERLERGVFWYKYTHRAERWAPSHDGGVLKDLTHEYTYLFDERAQRWNLTHVDKRKPRPKGRQEEQEEEGEE